MEIKEEKTLNNSSDARVYEVSYLLTPAVEENDVPAEYGNLKELISSLGGEFISDEMPKNIELAYTISKVIKNIRHKFDNAYFGWFKFTMDAEKVLELKKKLDLDTKVVRHLIIKTVRENTIFTKKFVKSTFVAKRGSDTTGENETPVEINKEEIDKEIDAMVEA